MKKRRWFWVLAVFGILLASVNCSAEEGITDTEIRIGQWGPQTGPAAPWGAVARGTDAMFKMINEEGGIHGRKLIHHMFDDAYNPAKTMAGVKELQEGKGMFAWVGGVGTACGLAVKDYLMEKKVLWVGPSAGSLHWITPPERYLFAVYPLYYIEAKALVKYAVENLKLKKIAIAYQNDDYGKNGVKGAEKQLEEYKLKLVAAVPVEKADSDMGPHVEKLKASGAEAVLLWVTPVHAVQILGTAKVAGYKPQWMSTSTCSDFPLMISISKGLWEGVIAATFGEIPDSDYPLLKKYKKDAYEKFAAKEERWGLFYYAGMLFAEPLVEALKRAGRDVNREKIVKVLEDMKDFKGIGGRISYKPYDKNDPSCRQGQKEVFLVQCLPEGKYKRLTDWIELSMD